MFRVLHQGALLRCTVTHWNPFASRMYDCFERSRDALCNVCDALVSEPQARSLPELSLSAFFQRRWPSVYEALQDGRINTERLRRVFVQTLIESQPADEPVWLGLERSGMERLEAISSRDRGMIYVPNMPHATKEVERRLAVFDGDALARSAKSVGWGCWSNAASAPSRAPSESASTNCAPCCP